MLTINPIISNYQNVQLKNKKRTTNTVVAPLRSYQTNQNVSFTAAYRPMIQRVAEHARGKNVSYFIENLTGCIAKPNIAAQANEAFKDTIIRFSQRKNPKQNFVVQDVENIKKSITPKNEPYLEKILSFKKR